jgi:hypothetical protein
MDPTPGRWGPFWTPITPEAGSLFHAVQQHSKIVAIDSDVLCIGSYNWLSADRQGQYARHETSFVYRGQHLEDEIRTIVGSLKRREK